MGNWDGSTLTAGTVVTYTCTTGSCVSVSSVCDPTTLLWNPAAISAAACDTCGGGGPGPTTAAPTVAPTDCGMADKLPALVTTAQPKKMKTSVLCQQSCAGSDGNGAEYFKFKPSKKVVKNKCWCLKVDYKTKKKFVS